MTAGEVAKRDGLWLPKFHWHHQHYAAGFYTDADAIAAYGKSEDKRKFVTEPAQQKAAANKNRWGSAKTWGKAATNVLSLDEDSWTAMIKKGGDGLLEDADKTSDVEWAMQLTLLAAIVVGAKAGSKMGESRGGRANVERVSAEEIRAEAREQGIDLPDDTGFQMRLNELTRQFNEMPEEQKGRTLREINKGNVNNAQAEYNEAKTPIERNRAKTKLDRVKKELAKYEGEYMKKGDPELAIKGYEEEGGGFFDIIDEEAAEKEPLLKKEKPKKESATKGLLDLPSKLNKKGGSLLEKYLEKQREQARKEAGKDPIKSDKLEEELEDGEEGEFEGDEIGDQLKEDPKPKPIEKGKKGKSKINPEGEDGTGASGKPKIVPEASKATPEIDEMAEKERIEKSLYSRTWEEYAQERELNAQRGKNAFAESWQSQNAREMGREAFEKGRNDYMLKQRPELEDEDILDLDFDEDLDQPFDRDEQNQFRYENEEVDLDFDENLDGEEEMNLEEEIFEEPNETDPLLGEEDRIEKDKLKKEFPSAGGVDITTAAELLGNNSIASSSGLWTEEDKDSIETTSTSTSPTSSGSVNSTEEISSLFKLKNTLNTVNLDELLRLTLRLNQYVYEPSLIGTPSLYEIDVPINTGNTNVQGDTEDTQVLFHNRRGVLYIVFRGTANTNNAIFDLMDKYIYLREIELFKNITNLTLDNDIQVHAGFANALASIYEVVREEMDKYASGMKVVFSGHSYGAALACLMYFIYEHDITNKDKKLFSVEHCVTWGSPRFLINETMFKSRYDSICPNVIRCWNTADPVPYFPNYLSSTVLPTPDKSPLLWIGMTGMMMGIYNRKKLMEKINDFKNIINRLSDVPEDILLNNRYIFNDVELDEMIDFASNMLEELRLDAGAINIDNIDPSMNPNIVDLTEELENLVGQRDYLIGLKKIKFSRQKIKSVKTILLSTFTLLTGGAFYGISNMLDNFDINSIYSLPKSLIHVGVSLCLDDTIGFTNINNLIKIVAMDSKYILKDIENQLNPNAVEQEEIYGLLQSKEFRSMLITGSLKCTQFTKDLEEQNPILLSRFVLNNIKDLSTYAEKCSILKPLLLDQYFKELKLSENPTVQDYALSVLSGIYINTIKTWNTGVPWSQHSLNQYKINVDRLVDLEVATQTAISVTMNETNKVDSEGRAIPTVNPLKITSKKGEIYQHSAPFNTTPLENKQTLENRRNEYISLPPIVGIYIGDYDNFSFIEY